MDDDKNPMLNDADDNKLMAEKLYITMAEGFLIRVGTYGKSYWYVLRRTTKKYMAKFGKKEWTLKKVNPKYFSFMCHFLKAKI